MAVISWSISPETGIQTLPAGSGSHMQGCWSKLEEYSCFGYRHSAGSRHAKLPRPLQKSVGARTDSMAFPGLGNRGVGRSGHIPTRKHHEVCSQWSYQLPVPQVQTPPVGQTAITNMSTVSWVFKLFRLCWITVSDSITKGTLTCYPVCTHMCADTFAREKQWQCIKCAHKNVVAFALADVSIRMKAGVTLRRKWRRRRRWRSRFETSPRTIGHTLLIVTQRENGGHRILWIYLLSISQPRAVSPSAGITVGVEYILNCHRSLRKSRVALSKSLYLPIWQ